MKMVALIITIVVSLLGGWIIGSIGVSMNCPNAGAFFAIVTMGAYILWAVRHPKDKQK